MPIVRMLLGLIGVVSIISMMVLWVMSIYYAATSKSKEMEGSRALWIILIVFTGLLGSVIYFLVDGKKREGIITILSVLALPIVLVLYAVLSFSIMATLNNEGYNQDMRQQDVMRLDTQLLEQQPFLEEVIVE